MTEFSKVNNERSEAIELIKLMDSVVSRNTWQIKLVGGESTLNTGTRRMFPDVILYGDTDRNRVLQGWELKMPDVPITDEVFIADAWRKADTLRVNSCVIWNFSFAVLYVKNGDNWDKLKEWSLPQIKTRADVSTYRADWSALAKDILFVVNEFFVRGELRSARLGDIISGGAYTTIILRNKSLTADTLRNAAARNTAIGAQLTLWWKSVEKEYKFAEKDKFSAYSDFVLLNWLNKLTFANLIKSRHNPAMAVERITEDLTLSEALTIFTEITAQCDFFNIFAPLDFADNLATDTWCDLCEYNAFLIENNVSLLPQETLQSVLESTIEGFKRNATGLFTTPVKLARILARAGMSNLTAPAIDPCCGTGTIAKEILTAKSVLGMEEAYATTYAADKFSFPLQVSNIAMTNANAINLPTLLFQHNAFELRNGDTIEIVNPADGKTVMHTLPKWGTLISNLPFVAFDQDGREEQEYIPNVRSVVKKASKITLSAKSDLYQFLLLDLWNRLADGASVAVITSNSWLGTVAGAKFFDALNMYYDVNAVVTSGNGKWFDNADVIAAMLFLTKKAEVAEPTQTHKIHFGLTQKRLTDFTDAETDDIITAIQLRKTLSTDLLSFRAYTLSEIATVTDIHISLNSLFYDLDWLSTIKPALCPVTDLFRVFRGMKTAQDDMYYLSDQSVVDAPYVGRVFKTVKDAEYLVAIADTPSFVCDKTLEELRGLGHTKTLQWIEKFRGHLNQSLPNKDTYWNNLANGSFSGSDDVRLFTGMNPEQRIFYGLLEEPSKLNQRAIGFAPLDESVRLELCHALLNSCVSVFYTEATGFPKGLGALDNCADNTKRIHMLDPRRLSASDTEKILAAFKPLLTRKVLTTEQEFKQADRLAFERVVAECFGYTAKLGHIISTVLNMQCVRLSVKNRP